MDASSRWACARRCRGRCGDTPGVQAQGAAKLSRATFPAHRGGDRAPRAALKWVRGDAAMGRGYPASRAVPRAPRAAVITLPQQVWQFTHAGRLT